MVMPGKKTANVRKWFSSDKQPKSQEEIREAMNEIYEWDKNLQYDKTCWRNFDEHQNKYVAEAASKNPFPNEKLLATFSMLAYKRNREELPADWVVLTEGFNTYEGSSTNTHSDTNTIPKGYFAVAFWNPKLRQVVVAHKGTNPKNLDDLKTDFNIFRKKGKSRQSQSAATFVHIIAENIKEASEKNIHIQLSITGHSLGGWLAQITTFTVKYLKPDGNYFVEDPDYEKNIHAHTVAFDSPGCRVALKNLRSPFVPQYQRRQFGNFDTLDITVNLNDVNCVNSLLEHVGAIYLTEASKHTIKDVIDCFNGDGTLKKKAVLYLPFGIGLAAKLLLTRRFDRVESYRKIPTKEYDDNIFSLNVFNETELDFVRCWNSALKDPDTREKLKNSYSIPSFVINEDYNTIGNANRNELLQTIATIKLLRPSKGVIFEKLSVKEQDKIIFYELVRKGQEYKNKLRCFQNYYFKDKYRLNELLQRDAQILHVIIDTEANIDMEMSILNNIFTNYRNLTTADIGFSDFNYIFLNEWNGLKVLPQVECFFKNRINVVIIECCKEDDNVVVALSKLKLTDTSIKVLAVSVDSWKNYNFKDKFEEVPGYGNELKYEDLTKSSQEELLELRFEFDKLKNIIQERPLPSDESLLELLQQPQDENLTLSCQDPKFLNNIYFVDFQRKIEPVCSSIRDDPQLRYFIEGPTNSPLDENLKMIFDKTCTNIEARSNVDFEVECNNLDKKKVAYLFKIKDGSLYAEKMYSNNLYTLRFVHYKQSVKTTIFKCKEHNYYFCGNNKQFFDSQIQSLDKQHKQRFKFISDVNEARCKASNEEQTAHLFKIKDNNIFWLYSNNEIDSLRKHVVLEKPTSISENNIFMDEKVVIIKGGAGTGKSSTIGHLHKYHKKKGRWVFTLSLQHSTYHDLAGKINFDSAAKFLLVNGNDEHTRFNEYLLSYCLSNKTKLEVYTFFDAFDEIQDDNDRERFLKLIEFLQRKSEAKILITTRPSRCEEVENKLRVFASCFKTAECSKERKTFLTKIWKTQEQLFKTRMTPKQLEEFVRKTLTTIDSSLGRTILNFEGVPLYTRMIAEIIKPPFAHPNSIAGNGIDITNILELYRNYVQSHYNIYFQRSGISTNIAQQTWLQQSISSTLRELSINMLSITSPDDHNDDLEEDEENCLSEELKELYKVGFVQFSRNNYHEFLHESFRDYFVADAMRVWLETYSEATCIIEEFIVSTFLTSSEYKATRSFVNCHLQSCEISERRLEQCRIKLEQLIEFWNEGDTAFHVVVREDLHFLGIKFLFKIVDDAKKIQLLSYLNSNIESPLFLAVKGVILKRETPATTNMLTLLFKELCRWKYHEVKQVLISAVCHPSTNDKHIDILHSYITKYLQSEQLRDDVSNRYNLTALYLKTCQTNCYEDLRLVLRKEFKDDAITKALLSRKTDKGETGLHLTTDVETLKFLLEHGANINSQDNNGMTPLNRAIGECRTEIAIELIKKGADTGRADKKGYSPLITAAMYNNLEILKLLILSEYSCKPDLNQTNCYGVTALMLAANYGNCQVVELLLDNGADPQREDIRRMTVVHHSMSGGHFWDMKPIFEKFNIYINIEDLIGFMRKAEKLFKGSKKQSKNPKKSLDNMCETNCCEHLKRALEKLRSGQKEKRDFLFRKNDSKETSLHLTTCVEELKLLLQHRSKINAQDINGMTPLNRAIKNRRRKIAKVLIEKKADISIADKMGYSPLINAARYGDTEILNLVFREDHVNLGTNFGSTALMFAARYGHYEAMEYLLENGADPTLKDGHGNTVVHYSKKEKKNYPVLKLIFEKFGLEERNGNVQKVRKIK